MIVRRLVKILLILVFVIAFIVFVFSLNTKNVPSPTYEPTVEPHLEMTNTELLKASLTTSDYIAYQDRLRDFVTYNNASPISKVEIVAVTAPERMGTATSITVKIASLQNQEFTTIMDYADGENGSFSVPTAQYKTTLYGRVYD